MIDPLARRSLSQDVRRLVTGRMTNYDFSEVFEDNYESEDAAVRVISSFCDSLYGDWREYRLRGRHAVDPKSRSTAARSVLFLRSGLEYQWPPTPDVGCLESITSMLMTLGIGLLLFGLAFALIGANDLGIPLAVLGLTFLAGSVGLRFPRRASLARQWKSFFSAGDFEVWPFLNRNDFDRARRECHLLGK